MIVVEAPGAYQSLPIKKKRIIFLAGSIENGEAEPWQQEVIDRLNISGFDQNRTIVLNPRRKDWDTSWEQTMSNPTFREQVEWELCGIDDADLVLFYFDPDTKSPISLMELGTMVDKKSSCIVCCPEGYWKKGNVDILCEMNGIYLFHTKDEFLDYIENLKWK